MNILKTTAVTFVVLAVVGAVIGSNESVAQNTVMAEAEKNCRNQLHSENIGVEDVDGFGVYELNGSTAEVWVLYNRTVNGKIYKNVSMICDVQVPAGTQLIDGELTING